MTKFLRKWFCKIPPPPKHRHDYDMVFDRANPFDYSLRCSCGDEALDMPEAIRKMYEQLTPRERNAINRSRRAAQRAL